MLQPSTVPITLVDAKKLEHYLPQAYNKTKRFSVDINKRLLANEQVHYNEHHKAVIVKETEQRKNSPGPNDLF